ncbi:MAG: DUF898 family protein [Pseudomonadota bacterium]
MDHVSRDQTASEGEAVSVGWTWPRGMLGLSLVNFVLRILTLGIYSFWATNETRKRIWSGIRFNGEPLTYTGRGLELFIGFLLVIPIFVAFGAALFAINYYFAQTPSVVIPATIAVYVVLFMLVGLAVYRSWRYRLARTHWRGIRASLEGNQWSFAWTYFWTSLLIPLTLGWISPWRTTKLQRLLVSSSRFGTRPFRFTATSGPLYGPFALLYFGSIATFVGVFGTLFQIGMKARQAQELGLTYTPTPLEGVIAVVSIPLGFIIFIMLGAWYGARVVNHFAKHTHFESASFSANTTALGFIWIGLTNLILAILGIAAVSGVTFLAMTAFVPLEQWQLAINPELDPQIRANIMAALTTPFAIAIALGATLFAPIIQARTIGYIMRRTTLSGTVPLNEIEQSQGADIKYGEGLAGAFDVDAF